MPDAPRIITRAELEDLLDLDGQQVLSIYQPATRAAVEPEENSLHLKNLLREAADRLEGSGARRPEIDELLDPLENLLRDRNFWLHQLGGLALFRTRDSLRYFRIPYEVPERTFVSGAPYVKPLLPALWPEARFYILALSQHRVRLLRATRYGVEEVDLSELDFPKTLAEALRYDDLQKPELQHHPTTGPGRGPQGQGGADTGKQQRGPEHGFHGHGEVGEGHKHQIRRFLQGVDKGLSEIFGKGETAPVVLAGVEYIQSMYRDVTGYRNITKHWIEGNTDRWRNEQLHEAAMPIIERRQREEIEGLTNRYGEAGSNGLASRELNEILPAAYEGRVDTLFLLGTESEWGQFDATTQAVFPAGETVRGQTDIDLHDLAARLTIRNGGTVYVLGPVEMPAESKIAATYRYNPAITS